MGLGFRSFSSEGDLSFTLLWHSSRSMFCNLVKSCHKISNRFDNIGISILTWGGTPLNSLMRSQATLTRRDRGSLLFLLGEREKKDKWVCLVGKVTYHSTEGGRMGSNHPHPLPQGEESHARCSTWLITWWVCLKPKLLLSPQEFVFFFCNWIPQLTFKLS